MLRYRLSRVFTRYAERFLPGDSFFGTTAAQNMQINRDHYRDQAIDGVRKLYFLFNTGLHLQSDITETGKARLSISTHGHHSYDGYAPATIDLSTECSDFLLACGREAAFCLQSGDRKEIIYYGNSYNPDNDSQHLNMPNHIGDLRVIASEIGRMAYASLYAQYQKHNGARPAVIEMQP